MLRKNLIAVYVFLTVVGCSIFAQANVPVELKGQQMNMRAAEAMLSKLGYWIVKVDGRPDASTRHAIMAFQKVEGRKRTGVLSAADFEALRSAERPVAQHNTGAVHIEIDLTRQVLFYVDESGTVMRVLPISSGNEKKFRDQGMWKVAHTPRGNFHIHNRINGVRRSTLGLLYYPNYFYGGIAIHGSNSIPSQPASHGCVRIPRFADRALFAMTRKGMEVFVYD